MKEKDDIKELFKQKLSSHEVPVNPQLWNAVSSQIGASAASSASMSAIKSIFIKSFIGISAAAIVIAAYVYLTNSETSSKSNNQALTIKEEIKPIQKTVIVSETPSKQEVLPKKTVIDEKKKPKKEKKPVSEVPETIELIPSENSFLVRNVPEKIVIKEVKGIDNEELNQTYFQENIVTGGTPEPQQVIAEENLEPIENSKAPEETTESQTQEEKLEILLPNVFTPNGDGSNDYLLIKSEGFTDFTVVVLDRSSKVIFKSEDANFQWNGTMINGEPVPNGNYVYYFTAKNGLGELIQKHSSLRITR
ncbi:MAG: gliding motility-associated C-terminal domain-containing protein [Crocinitomicaceae bacterium]|nr:gliding motility-associated C-terminal domain-containing protein [Crocinitomicaceae bacterium]